jgi:hypothetical protein
MVRNVSFNERSGIFTITYLNGSTKELDTKLEKIAVNFEYDAERQKLILELIDGTYQEIDMSALITEYEFEDSAYISWTVTDGKVKAEIIGGSITEDMLQPNFLADCRLYAGNAENSATLAGEYAQQAKESAESISNNASDIVFDDTTSQLGADDVQGAIDNIVDIITPVFISKSGGAKSIPNTTATNTNSITITRGVWYVAANVRWDALNSSGVRNIYIVGNETAADGTASNEGSMDRLIGTIHGTDKAYETQVVHGIIRSSSEKNLYLHVYQNSGSTLETSYNILVAYKLSDLFV